MKAEELLGQIIWLLENRLNVRASQTKCCSTWSRVPSRFIPTGLSLNSFPVMGMSAFIHPFVSAWLLQKYISFTEKVTEQTPGWAEIELKGCCMCAPCHPSEMSLETLSQSVWTRLWKTVFCDQILKVFLLFWADLSFFASRQQTEDVLFRNEQKLNCTFLTAFFLWPVDSPSGAEPGGVVGVHPVPLREETWIQLGRGALRLLCSVCWRWDDFHVSLWMGFKETLSRPGY